MRRKGYARRWLAAAVSAAALMLGAGPVQAHGPQPLAAAYVNLHQCVYYSSSAGDHFTAVVPGSDGRFGAGTNVSTTAGTRPICGSGDGNYSLVSVLSGVKALDLRGGRYLNLHQCVYYSSSAGNHFTSVVTASDGRFGTGTNVSTTADTSPICGSGDGNYQLVPVLSGVKSLDLTTGSYLNLHQCVYYSSSAGDHFTAVVPGSDGRFGAGTNVSTTAGTSPICGSGDGNYSLVSVLSGVRALSLS